jgi:hypothetical protein
MRDGPKNQDRSKIVWGSRDLKNRSEVETPVGRPKSEGNNQLYGTVGAAVEVVMIREGTKVNEGGMAMQ